jgi:hypothetical protein
VRIISFKQKVDIDRWSVFDASIETMKLHVSFIHFSLFFLVRHCVVNISLVDIRTNWRVSKKKMVWHASWQIRWWNMFVIVTLSTIFVWIKGKDLFALLSFTWAQYKNNNRRKKKREKETAQRRVRILIAFGQSLQWPDKERKKRTHIHMYAGEERRFCSNREKNGIDCSREEKKKKKKRTTPCNRLPFTGRACKHIHTWKKSEENVMHNL